MERVAAVVVTYNRKELLAQCIKALLGQQNAVCDILIVDNASTDGTGAYLAALNEPRVQSRSTGANLGGAGGFNFGMRWAVEAGYDLVWIMDDDTLPHPDSLAQLLAAHTILGGNYGFLSSAVLWTDGTECKMNRQKIKKNFYEHVELLRHGLILVEQATFVSLLFPAAAIEKAGLPIRDFFIWGDDIEYTRRMTVRLGLPCYLAGQSQVTHAMKENNGSSIALDSPERISRYRYAFRNENYTYRHEGVRGVCYYIAKCGLNLCRIWAKAPGQRLRRSWIILSRMVSGLWFNPKVEQVRRPEAAVDSAEETGN